MTHENKIAITAAPILPVLANRWSPRAFDTDYKLTQHELLSVLEAARWAPSANNGQPWRYSVVERGTDLHSKLVPALAGWNAAWAPNASALIVVSAESTTADGQPHPWAHYDTGLSVGSLIIQAQELNLYTHQMAGLNKELAAQVLDLPEGLEIITVIAIGKIASAETLEGPLHEREVAPRVRKELDEIVLHGKP
jgi:nitroreductase